MMKHKKTRRLRAGFTLTELLMAMAVLAILFAVAAPGVAVVRKNLRILELD